jgi:hypothetical protein
MHMKLMLEADADNVEAVDDVSDVDDEKLM